jgi:hypothetical protein
VSKKITSSSYSDTFIREPLTNVFILRSTQDGNEIALPGILLNSQGCFFSKISPSLYDIHIKIFRRMTAKDATASDDGV